MSGSPVTFQPVPTEDALTDSVALHVSRGALNALHAAAPDESGRSKSVETDEDQPLSTTKHPLADILVRDTAADDRNYDGEASDVEQHPLKVRISKDDDAHYHSGQEDDSSHPRDTLRWFRMGTDRSMTPHTYCSDTPVPPGLELNRMPTLEDKWEEFILHLRHVASYKAEYDIYQVLAYRAMVSWGQKIYVKPFKSLKGMISDEWAELEVRWLNSFQRVLSQAIICFCIQTLGVTAILITQFSAYFGDLGDYAQCDSTAASWRQEWHLKILAFLWTSFISLGVSGWVYRARHSGFYPMMFFLKRAQYPNFISVTILQLGLLTNYYVVASSVIGSFILIYQTEGGTETIGMILQAVALFFILELDNKIVHSRDFISIRNYFDAYIRAGKHKKLPQSVLKEGDMNCVDKPLKRCRGNSCLFGTLSVTTFVLLVLMTLGAFVAPLLIMICW